jgi:hypothetical protein
MDDLGATSDTPVLRYLHDEAPWEFERLESIGRLVRLWPDWGTGRADPLPTSEADWFRRACGALS